MSKVASCEAACDLLLHFTNFIVEADQVLSGAVLGLHSAESRLTVLEGWPDAVPQCSTFRSASSITDSAVVYNTFISEQTKPAFPRSLRREGAASVLSGSGSEDCKLRRSEERR
jgi:hypothetical protein